jgi:hypothetical protein
MLLMHFHELNTYLEVMSLLTFAGQETRSVNFEKTSQAGLSKSSTAHASCKHGNSPCEQTSRRGVSNGAGTVMKLICFE